MRDGIEELVGDEEGYNRDMKEEITNTLRRIHDEMRDEVQLLGEMTEKEGEIIQVMEYALNETELAEDVEHLQEKEERQTVNLGKRSNNKQLMKTGKNLLQVVLKDEKQSYEQAKQEAWEAQKMEEESQATFKEAERVKEEASKVLEAIDYLAEDMGGDMHQDFKDRLVDIRAAYEDIAERAEEIMELSREEIQEAEEVSKEAKEASR